MTGLLQEKEFSRKSFLKGGGALIVGFSLAGAGLAGNASASGGDLSPYGSNPIDHNQIDSWIVINADNTASVKSGAIFQGTGSPNGILMIAADELDMDFDQMSFVTADTSVTPETGKKAASNTINGGAGLSTRAVAASARQVLLGLASTQLGVPAAQLSVSKGVVSGGGKSVTYGDLLGGKLFNVTLPASYKLQDSGNFPSFNGGLLPGQAPAKSASQYKVVGTSPPRIDIPAIVAGTATYIHNVRVPGMLHGRVVLPRGQSVLGFGAPIVSIDEGSIKHLPNVRIVRKGDFLGVVAPKEYDAIQAAAQLKVKWADPPAALPGGGDELAQMRALDAAGKTVVSNVDLGHAASNNGDVDSALAGAAHTVSGEYGWPTNVHGPIGPNCAVADVTPQGARVFAGTQGVYEAQGSVAEALGLPLSKVRVTAFPISGAYGAARHNEAAQAAALLSQLAGAPVRMQFMRWDEHGWDNYGPGTVMDVRAGIDGKGNIVAIDYSHIYPQYLTDTDSHTPMELAGIAPLSSSVSGNWWPGSMYNAPNNRYTLKSIPLVGNWVKSSWMRAGASPHATFALEQVVDDLARTVQMDPVAFRLQNVTQRASDQPEVLLAVMSAVTQAAGWQPKVSGSSLSDANIVTGRGVAWSNADGRRGAGAAIADVTVNKKTGKITVNHVYQAYNAGLMIYPGDVANQQIGGITQVLSRLLVEQLRYTKTKVASLDWVSYPILRFKDAPKVTPIVVQLSNLPPSGVGEPVTAVAPAAVANAFFDATGVRIRQAPMTPANVRATLKAAGVA
jgi:CO/xanthine dehydrogenase Mo-binding subunit